LINPPHKEQKPKMKKDKKTNIYMHRDDETVKSTISNIGKMKISTSNGEFEK
jgi:hypothetical protein